MVCGLWGIAPPYPRGRGPERPGAFRPRLARAASHWLGRVARLRPQTVPAGALAAMLAAPALVLAEVRLETSVNLVAPAVAGNGAAQRWLPNPALVAPGDELRYVIGFTNTGLVPLDSGAIVITNPIPEGAEYLFGSAGGDGARVLHALDGKGDFLPFDQLVLTGQDGRPRSAAAADVRALRWIYELSLAPGASSEVWFHVRLMESVAADALVPRGTARNP